MSRFGHFSLQNQTQVGRGRVQRFETRSDGWLEAQVSNCIAAVRLEVRLDRIPRSFRQRGEPTPAGCFSENPPAGVSRAK